MIEAKMVGTSRTFGPYRRVEELDAEAQPPDIEALVEWRFDTGHIVRKPYQPAVRGKKA